MLLRTLKLIPNRSYRPSVQNRLTRMAPNVSHVLRHDRNMRNNAPSVRTKIGGVNFSWLSRVTRLYHSVISRLPL